MGDTKPENPYALCECCEAREAGAKRGTCAEGTDCIDLQSAWEGGVYWARHDWHTEPPTERVWGLIYYPGCDLSLLLWSPDRKKWIAYEGAPFGITHDASMLWHPLPELPGGEE